MSNASLLVLLTGAGTVVLTSLGPFVLGGRGLSPRLSRVLSLLAPCVLAALAASQTFGASRRLVLDERAVGVAVAGLLAWCRAPLLVVLLAAATVTATARAI